MKQLFELLVKDGGKIVSTNDCSPLQIALARSQGRMWVNEHSLGFIHIPKSQTDCLNININ